jgi:hypothetical protein
MKGGYQSPYEHDKVAWHQITYPKPGDKPLTLKE